MDIMTEDMVVDASRRYTLADVYGGSFPDDGRRYEIIDGVLYVSPFASRRHQLVAVTLTRLLYEHRPRDLLVIGPTNVDRPDDSHVEPDIVVIRRGDFDVPEGLALPLLIAEVLSPSTRRHDQVRKPRLYERMGVASYWLVDPVQPAISVLELGQQSTYREVTHVVGAETLTVSQPYPVSFAPADLLADLTG